MNYKKSLEYLGYTEGVDFELTEGGFEMLEKTRSVVVDTIHHDAVPAVLDEEDNVITPEVPAYDEQIFGDETYTPEAPSEALLESAWENIQMKEADVALLVTEFLIGKDDLRDFENDSINIVDGFLKDWNFVNIPRPTNSELIALIPTVSAKVAKATRRDAVIAAGKKDREMSDNALAVIAGLNREMNLTPEQITTMQTTFSVINAYLMNARPSSAKQHILAVQPTEIVTQEMLDMVLEELAEA